MSQKSASGENGHSCPLNLSSNSTDKNVRSPFENEKIWNVARFALVGVWLAVLYVMFRPAAYASIGAWQTPANDMLYGWAVAPIALLAAWSLRDKLRAAAGRPAWGGLVLLLLVCALVWLGHRGGQSRFSQLALVLSIPVVAWTGWGRNVAKTLLFPTAFMLFIIPFNFLDVMTLPLRLLSSWLSMLLLNGFGIGVIRQGSALVSATGRFNLDVVDPCSGIKSIFAIMAISAAYGFFYQKTTLRAFLVMGFAIPVAVIANIVRLTTIGMVAHHFGQAKAMHIFHDASGLITFPVAILLMMVFGERVAEKIGKVPPPAPAAPPAKQAPWPAGICFLLLAAALSAGMVATLNRLPLAALEPDDFIALSLPQKLGHIPGQRIWYCHQMDCQKAFSESKIEDWNEDNKPLCVFCDSVLFPISYGEKILLPGDTRMMKSVYEDGQDSYTVTVVVSGMSRVSIHRPDLCLPGQGYQIVGKTIHPLTLNNGKRLDILLYKVRKAGTDDIGFANFLVSNRLQTGSHFHRILHDVLQRSLFGRVNRWAMFTIVSHDSFDTPEQLERLRVLLSDWLPQVWSGAEQ